ncbi:MAG: hypothetical protein WBD63_05240 [Phycisphaerae bacterium]|nr:hypothetical protein [Phycisphaerae bacterium]
MLSQEDTRDALGVVGYEVWMLNVATRHFTLAQSLGYTALENLALECFALHARTLYEFFFKNSSGGYIRVGDLLSAGHPLKKPPRFSEHMAKMNNQLAHITRARLLYNRDPKNKAWQLDEVLDNLRNAVSEFKRLARERGLNVDRIPDVADGMGG